MVGEEAKASSKEKLQKKRKHMAAEEAKASSKEKLQKKRKHMEDEDVNDDQSVLKKSNSQQLLCVGMSCNLNERKKNILLYLSDLLPGLKPQIITTDNRSEALKNDKCSYGSK